MKSIFRMNGNALSDGLFTGWASQNAILLIIGIVLCTPVCRRINGRIGNHVAVQWIRVLALICLFVLSAASLVSNMYNPFIYFNF